MLESGSNSIYEAKYKDSSPFNKWVHIKWVVSGWWWWLWWVVVMVVGGGSYWQNSAFGQPELNIKLRHTTHHENMSKIALCIYEINKSRIYHHSYVSCIGLFNMNGVDK